MPSADTCLLNLKRKMMEVTEFEPIDNYERKCGEIFLTLRGDITFLCTLCENRYECFQDYADHLITEHDYSSFNKECSPLHGVIHKEEDFYETFLKNEESNLILSEEIAAIDNEKIIEVLDEESTLDIVSKKLEAKQNNSIYVKLNDSFDKDSNTSANANKNNPGKNKKSKDQACRKSSRKKTERPIFKCTECDFTCKDKSNLMGHIKRHSNRKPYKCSECHKQFYTRTELKSHYRRHTGERPFLCTECGQTFFTSGILSAHIKRHKNIRDKECSVCHKCFFDAATLAAHMRIHTGERPFKCKLCPSSFKRGNALLSHMKMHENKREHQCEFCAARFNQKCNLKAHRKSKHLLAISAVAEHTSKIVVLKDC